MHSHAQYYQTFVINSELHSYRVCYRIFGIQSIFATIYNCFDCIPEMSNVDTSLYIIQTIGICCSG